MTDSSSQNNVSTGVQGLIEQLKTQGVSSGRAEAANIVADARSEAKALVDQAKYDAEVILKDAQKQADFTVNAGTEALILAERDTVLELKEFLIETFSQQVATLIHDTLSDKDVIKHIILEMAGKEKPGLSQPVEIILPERVIGIDELRKDPELIKQGRLLSVVMGNAADMLKTEIEFKVDRSDFTGIKFRLNQQAVEIDFSDKAITAILLQHLQPRFRALLEGIIK